MSEEEAEKPSSGGGSDGGGSVLKKWGPLAAIVLVAQVTVAWVLITTVFKDRAGSADHAPEPILSETQVQEGCNKEESSGELLEYFSPPGLKKIVANPTGTDGAQVVMLSVDLGLKNLKPLTEKKKKESGGEGGEEKDPDMDRMTPYLPKMKAMIIEIVSSKGVVELSDPETRKELQDEIKKQLNSKILSRLYVKDEEDEKKKMLTIEEVIFSDFVIQ